MVLLNGPPLSNFVDRGLGEWEWLGPGSTKPFCVTRPKTYLLWFWLPPSFPIRSSVGQDKKHSLRLHLPLCLKRVGIYLPRPGVFGHGQLYVAISQVSSRDGLKLLVDNSTHAKAAELVGCTRNVVYREVFPSF